MYSEGTIKIIQGYEPQTSHAGVLRQAIVLVYTEGQGELSPVRTHYC